MKESASLTKEIEALKLLNIEYQKQISQLTEENAALKLQLGEPAIKREFHTDGIDDGPLSEPEDEDEPAKPRSRAKRG